jgi:hypothetical protein
MNTRTRSIRNRILALALPVAATFVVAPSAQAGPLVASAEDCDAQDLSQPFMPWADPASYTLAPDGGFEEGGSSWSLNGGASVGSGNESYNVRNAGDTHSLKLPSGSSAKSATMCVGLEHPTLRLFARNTGSPLSTLKVAVHFEDAAGNVHSLPIGVVAAGSSWQPTQPMLVTANLLALLPGEQTPVAFEFTPLGFGGNWRIDDVYVDPYRRS